MGLMLGRAGQLPPKAALRAGGRVAATAPAPSARGAQQQRHHRWLYCASPCAPASCFARMMCQRNCIFSPGNGRVTNPSESPLGVPVPGHSPRVSPRPARSRGGGHVACSGAAWLVRAQRRGKGGRRVGAGCGGGAARAAPLGPPPGSKGPASGVGGRAPDSRLSEGAGRRFVRRGEMRYLSVTSSKPSAFASCRGAGAQGAGRGESGFGVGFGFGFGCWVWVLGSCFGFRCWVPPPPPY